MGIPYTYFTDILSEANTSERSLSSSPNSNLVSNLHHGRNGLRQEKRVRISDEGGYVYSTTDVVVPSDSDVPTSSSLNPDEDNGLIHRLPHRDYMSAEIGSGINLRRHNAIRRRSRDGPTSVSSSVGRNSNTSPVSLGLRDTVPVSVTPIATDTSAVGGVNSPQVHSNSINTTTTERIIFPFTFQPFTDDNGETQYRFQRSQMRHRVVRGPILQSNNTRETNADPVPSQSSSLSEPRETSIQPEHFNVLPIANDSRAPQLDDTIEIDPINNSHYDVRDLGRIQGHLTRNGRDVREYMDEDDYSDADTELDSDVDPNIGLNSGLIQDGSETTGTIISAVNVATNVTNDPEMTPRSNETNSDLINGLYITTVINNLDNENSAVNITLPISPTNAEMEEDFGFNLEDLQTYNHIFWDL